MANRWSTCVDKHPRNRIYDMAAMQQINRLNAQLPGTLGGKELASEWNKRWTQKTQLRIRFLDGDPDVHKEVERQARTWEAHINLELVFGNTPDADIRISFEQEGYWSYVGIDARLVSDPEATMNFGGWSTIRSVDARELRRTVLHEFGHAFGCVHEHQAPDAGIPWDVEKVLSFYYLTQDWSAQETYTQVLHKYSRDLIRSTAWDSTSIMQYPVESFLTTNGFSVPWNNELSGKDIEFIKVMYPRD